MLLDSRGFVSLCTDTILHWHKYIFGWEQRKPDQKKIWVLVKYKKNQESRKIIRHCVKPNRPRYVLDEIIQALCGQVKKGSLNERPPFKSVQIPQIC